MTEEEVINLFGRSFKLPDGSIGNAKSFSNLFSDVSSNPTYDELVNFDNGELGYIDFFDECKEKGLIE